MNESQSSHTAQASGAPAGKSRDWNWHPDLPIDVSPLFTWPLRPASVLRWLTTSWLTFTENVVFVALAFSIWLWLLPSLELMREPDFGWILSVWLRNVALMVVLAGGLHLWLYGVRRQGDTFRFSTRNSDRAKTKFTFNDQLLDNLFWSLVWGVTIWTMIEVGIWMAYANGVAPMISFSDHPVWFVSLFFLLPVYHGVHFFLIHRLIHVPVIYRNVHHIHHRNITPQPWSGLSMHPVEHVLYFSALLVFLVLPAHPVHLLFLILWLTVGAATSHSGYQSVVLAGKAGLKVGSFFHQLHHQYFECNYGTVEIPMDRWMGSFHNGTTEATSLVRKRTIRNRRNADSKANADV